MTLTVGIWMEWRPGTSLLGEGSWALLTQVVEASLVQDVRYVLLMPSWLEASIEPWRDRLSARFVGKLDTVTHHVSRSALKRRAARAWRKEYAPQLRSRAPLRWLVDFFKGGRKRLRNARRTRRAIVKEAMIDCFFDSMARTANKMSSVDVWLIPFSGFHNSTRIDAPKVSIFHDFLHADFPDVVTSDVAAYSRAVFRNVLLSADCCIALSRYVRERHGIEHLGLRPERVFVIPPAQMDRRGLLPFIPSDFTKTADSRTAAGNLLRRYCADMDSPNLRFQALCKPYLRDFPFEHVDYIVVSTQNRPHKRVLQVVKIVERLIRHEFRAIKLIMTGAFDLDDPNDEIGSYVAAKALHCDVLCLPRLPIDVHTALYHAAAVTVHPSPFEGSFPFPFGESVSVGTPVVLARSAVVADDLDGTCYAEIAYDSDDLEEATHLVARTLDHREDALALQIHLFRERAARTPNHVAQDYLALLTAVANSRPCSKQSPGERVG